MNNSDKPANPFVPSWDEESANGFMGLTKREYFAVHILTGLCVPAIPGHHNIVDQQIKETVPNAIQLADALLKQLAL